MINERNHALRIIEIVLAVPLLFLLWVLATDLVEKYGLIVLPVGGALYLLISVMVDKLFSRQSEQLEQALERKLPFVADKHATMRKSE